MKTGMTLFCLCLVGCASISKTSPVSHPPWLPPIAAIHSPITDRMALWPDRANRAILPVHIGVRQSEGLITEVSALYLAKDVDFAKVRDAINADFPQHRSPSAQSACIKWLIPEREILVSLIGNTDYSTVTFQAYKDKPWLLPLRGGKISAEPQGGGYSSPASRPSKPTP